MAAPADISRLLSRYGRQLLVDGVEPTGQEQLARWAACFDGDGSEFAGKAGQVAAHYLAGAGIGRVGFRDGQDGGVGGIDQRLVVLDTVADAEPPAAHIYIATRPYGASFDIVATPSARGWHQGKSRNARVCTVSIELGKPAQRSDAPFVGAIAADLLLCDLLGVEPMPATARYNWTEDGEPSIRRSPAEVADGDEWTVAGHAAVGLLAELTGCATAYQPILDDVVENYPNEACGLVLRDQDGALSTVVCGNLQDRYHALDPEAYPRTARAAFKLNELQIVRAAERGQELVCIYHSHCDAGAYFSAEDVRCAAPDGEALYPGVGYLVVSVFGGQVRAAEMFHFDEEHKRFLPEGPG